VNKNNGECSGNNSKLVVNTSKKTARLIQTWLKELKEQEEQDYSEIFHGRNFGLL
jgi:hypothetical protein